MSRAEGYGRVGGMGKDRAGHGGDVTLCGLDLRWKGAAIRLQALPNIVSPQQEKTIFDTGGQGFYLGGKQENSLSRVHMPQHRGATVDWHARRQSVRMLFNRHLSHLLSSWAGVRFVPFYPV